VYANSELGVGEATVQAALTRLLVACTLPCQWVHAAAWVLNHVSFKLLEPL